MVLRNDYCIKCYQLLKIGDEAINFISVKSWHRRCVSGGGFSSRKFDEEERWKAGW